MNLRILGPIEVTDDSGGSLQLGKRMERALLALMVLHSGRTVSTDACIEALWPNGAPARPDASLHSLVARLRRTLEPERPAGTPSTRLVHDPSGYRLVARHDEVDSRRFTQAADRGRALLAAGDATGAHRHLAAALAEWRGPALGEFAYDPFAEHAALQLEDLRVGAVEADLGARLGLGATTLIPELDAFVAEHPLREHAWAYLVTALYRAGRQTEALRRADDLRSTLAEVGLEPSPWVRRTVDAVVTHDPELTSGPLRFGTDADPDDDAAADLTRADTDRVYDDATGRSGTAPPTSGAGASDGATPPLPRWWQPSEHFVGRERELLVVRDAFFRCQSGDVAAVVVSGEPGIGKSSFAVEAAERTHVSGATILAGRTSATSSVAYEPLGEAFGRLVGTLTDERIHLLGDHASRLSRLLPGLGDRLGSWPADGFLGTDVESHLLFEAVSTLVGQQADTAPTVLVVDDLQWADPAALDLLDHLLRSDATRSLLIIVTVRSEDLDADPRLRRFVDSWYRTGTAVPVELGGLDLDEITELVAPAGATDDEADPLLPPRTGTESTSYAEALLAVTAGNPFFLVEMNRHLTENGTGLVDASPLAPRSGQGPVPGTVPESVQALVRSRLDRLDTAHRRILRLAALEASRIDLSLLGEVDGDVDAVAQAVDAAVAAGLLIERGGTVLFQHELVRTVLDAEIGPAQRARWHRALAEAYRRRAVDDDDVRDIVRIARHFAEAAADGDATDAVATAQRAGDVAIGALAFASAAETYAAGLRAAARGGPIGHDARVELEISLLEARWMVGDFEQASVECLEFLDDFEQHASLTQLHRFAQVCARSTWAAEPEEMAAFDEGLARIEARFRAAGADHADDVVRIVLARALNELTVGSRRAVDRYAEILREASPSWPLDLRVLVVDSSVIIVGERSPIAERVARITELYDDVHGDPDAPLEQRQIMASAARWAALTTGDIARALELGDLMEAQAERLGMPRYLAGAAQRRASLELARGRIDAAERSALEAIQHRPDAEFEEGYLAQLAMIRLYQGRIDELIDGLGDLGSDAGPPWSVGLALMLAEVGDLARARTLLQDFVAGLDTWDRDISWLGTLAFATYADELVRDTAVAEALLDELRPHTGRVAMAGQNALILGTVDTLMGMLLAVLGRFDEADAHLRAADGVLDALGAKTLIARRELVHAEVLAASSGPGDDEAQRHAQAAWTLIDELGFHSTLRERARRLVD